MTPSDPLDCCRIALRSTIKASFMIKQLYINTVLYHAHLPRSEINTRRQPTASGRYGVAARGQAAAPTCRPFLCVHRENSSGQQNGRTQRNFTSPTRCNARRILRDRDRTHENEAQKDEVLPAPENR